MEAVDVDNREIKPPLERVGTVPIVFETEAFHFFEKCLLIEGIFKLPQELDIIPPWGIDIFMEFCEALEWLAAMCSHVPDKGEQMFSYYGYYSNVCRGKRRKENQDALLPCILEPAVSSKGSKKSWARLIRKIYEVPLSFL